MFNQHLYLIIQMSSSWPSNNFYYVDSPLVSNYIILISGFITDIQIYTNTILFQHCITVNRNYLIRIYPYDHPANFYYWIHHSWAARIWISVWYADIHITKKSLHYITVNDFNIIIRMTSRWPSSIFYYVDLLFELFVYADIMI